MNIIKLGSGVFIRPQLKFSRPRFRWCGRCSKQPQSPLLGAPHQALSTPSPTTNSSGVGKKEYTPDGRCTPIYALSIKLN
jgi:hypothetical protein